MSLKDYLYFNRITITKFAKTIGVSRCYMNRIVSGKLRPSVYLAKMIQEGTEGKVNYLDLII